MVWIVFAIISALLVVCLWERLGRVFRLFRAPEAVAHLKGEVPSVSLCIPARNEVHAMTDCLEAALLSDYQKLEIIVLDDESHDTTGQAIKSFAHAGVRFVEGSALPAGWLGKNHALGELAEEASAGLILFIDVDTRLDIQSIEQVVAYMQQEEADMVSILPLRKDWRRASALAGTLRQFWNMTNHRAGRPTTAGGAWIIRREALEGCGGFAAAPLEVSPEQFFATQLAREHKYRFVLSSLRFGVTYEKKMPSQYETAVRLYYPLFGAGGCLLRMLGCMIVVLPYFGLIAAIVRAEWAGAIACLLAVSLLSLMNAWYLGVLRSRRYVAASLVLPYVLIREIVLFGMSMVAYWRGAVTWKGRPVRMVR